MGVLYRITNNVNKKMYFGQTIRLKRRKDDYFKYGYFPNSHIKNSFNKYGKENFEFDVMFECSEEMLDVCEELLIYLLDTQNPDKGYNKDSGGNLNKHRSEESKEKQSKSMKEYWDSEAGQEEKQKRSGTHSGENNINYGKTGENHPKYGYTKKNTVGYYRVHKYKTSDCKQGFTYRYKYYENGKQRAISSVDIKTLEEKVKARGLEWRKL